MRGAWTVAVGAGGVALAVGLALVTGGVGVTIGGGCDSAGEACVPMCDGLSCGDDGCGGVCGTCDGPSTCQAGACVCVPDCSGKFCADDGCGAACFACPSGFACGAEDSCDSVDGSEAYVPAGAFAMGCNEVSDDKCAADEKPARVLSLPAYAVDVHEVTAGEFKACVDANGCSPIKASHCSLAGESTFLTDGAANRPVNCVDYARAVKYCEWRGRALCNEAQWEKAARGGCETTSFSGTDEGAEACKSQARIYPWGTGEPVCADAVMQKCATEKYAHEVGSRDRDQSVYGARDMAGNVAEWTADYYQSAWYTTAPDGDPRMPPSGAFRTTRGGSYASPADAVRVSKRFSQVPTTDVGYEHLGFRCCRSLSSE
jgi:sulfatase modifying factor 1